jgi:hypothetical protein
MPTEAQLGYYRMADELYLSRLEQRVQRIRELRGGVIFTTRVRCPSTPLDMLSVHCRRNASPFSE